MRMFLTVVGVFVRRCIRLELMAAATVADAPVPDEIVHSVLIDASAETVFAVIREPGWFINDGEYREHEITTSGPVTRVVDPVHGSFQLGFHGSSQLRK